MTRISAVLALMALLLAPASALAVNPKTLDMGKNVQVWYVEDHTLPMIAMTAALPAGSAYDPRNKPGLAAFTAATISGMCNRTSGQGELPKTTTAILRRERFC